MKIDAILNGIDNMIQLMLILLMATLVGTVTADVIGRYFIGKSLIFSNELSRICFIWITFLVMPLGISRGLHVAITTLPDMLSESRRRFIYRLGVAIIAVLMVVVLMGAWVSVKARGLEPLNTLPISAAWFYYPLLFGAAWSLVHLGVLFCRGEAPRDDSSITEHALP